LSILPLINSGRVRLLDNTRLLNQLLDLDRVANRGGRESVRDACEQSFARLCQGGAARSILI
jgi:hypothetical protein